MPISLLSGRQRQAVSLLMATLLPMNILVLNEHTALRSSSGLCPTYGRFSTYYVGEILHRPRERDSQRPARRLRGDRRLAGNPVGIDNDGLCTPGFRCLCGLATGATRRRSSRRRYRRSGEARQHPRPELQVVLRSGRRTDELGEETEAACGVRAEDRRRSRRDGRRRRPPKSSIVGVAQGRRQIGRIRRDASADAGGTFPRRGRQADGAQGAFERGNSSGSTGRRQPVCRSGYLSKD